ncbi:MAG: hypothetical protein MJ252_25055, partial [archaeon]|nr:hypothetical protein [archaeon]
LWEYYNIKGGKISFIFNLPLLVMDSLDINYSIDLEDNFMKSNSIYFLILLLFSLFLIFYICTNEMEKCNYLSLKDMKEILYQNRNE